MDRYLEAIEKEESKIQLLVEKRKEIEESNKKRRIKESKYEQEEQKNNFKKQRYQKIKYYLDNQESCRMEFFKKAILFGLKYGIGFIGVTLALASLTMKINTIPILRILGGFSTISAMLGFVEYRYVSKEYRELLGDYRGNIENDLEIITLNQKHLQNEKIQNYQAMQDNQILLLEIDKTIKQLQQEVTSYRSIRNSLIDSLIANLDSYIVNFSPTEIDIHKIIEKKIQ